jgi:hypothetical protein
MARQCRSYGRCYSARSCEGTKKATAKGADRRFERRWCRVDEVPDVQNATKVPWNRKAELQKAKSSRSRDRASLLEIYDGEWLMRVMRYP